jgi:hypothetical protein
MALAKRKMQQVELPFDAQFAPGWQGYRYLRCTDNIWHLVLAVNEGGAADTQCCADVHLAATPTGGVPAPVCATCASLQFPEKKKPA